MSSLLEGVNTTKDSMVTKLKAENIKVIDYEKENKVLKENNKKLMDENYNLKNDNITLKQNIKSLDMNCDNLNNDLDAKCKDISQLQLMYTNLKTENMNLSNKLNSYNNMEKINGQKIFEKDLEIKKIKDNMLCNENDMKLLRAEIANKNMELNQISDQYKKLSIENKNLIQEIRRFANENERLNIIKSQGEQNSQLFFLQNKSQKIEINELNKNYNTVIKEKEKLKQNLKLFVEENKAAAEHIKKIEDDLNNYQINAQKLIKDKNDLIEKLNESEKRGQSLTEEINQLKSALDKKNNELIKNSFMNANNIININNNHNNINNSVMMNNNVVSDNEMINLLNQKISRMSSDNKALEMQIKMHKDEKKISKDTVQRLQYEVITLKKQLEMNNNSINNELVSRINQYKQQIYKLNNEINKIKNENTELIKQKNNNIINTQKSIKYNFNEEERNDDGELKAEQL